MGTPIKKQILRALALLLAVAGLVRAETSVSGLWAESLAAETGGDIAKALEIHEQILPHVENSYEASLRAGWLFYRSGKYSDALDHYENAAKLASGALAPLYGALNCQLALGETGRAEKVAKALVAVDEQNYTANLQLAWLYYQKEKFSVANAYYRKLNRLYPEDLAVASGLAWSYLELGKARYAAPLFETILMISPDYPLAEKGRDLCNDQ